MAVGMLQMLQGVTKQQYDQVNEAMFGQSPPSPDQVPEGLYGLCVSLDQSTAVIGAERPDEESAPEADANARTRSIREHIPRVSPPRHAPRRSGVAARP